MIQRLLFFHSKKFQASINIIKRFASQNTVSKTKISSCLTLRQVNPSTIPQNSKNFVAKKRPLVVLFNWLYANQSALDKYCNLYHDIGLDVLTVKGRLVHFLWPLKGKELAEDLLEFLLWDRPKEEKIFIHAFSIGAYNYTICETLALDKELQYGLFRDKIIGQIFDSIVLGSYENMSTGIASALNDNRFLRKSITSVMDLYYNSTKGQTRDVYDRLVQNFKEDPVVVPTLVFYSLDDPMCHVPTMQEMVEKWKKDFPGFDVSVKSWDKSVHAAHLKFHKDEYMDCWWESVEKVIQNKNS